MGFENLSVAMLAGAIALASPSAYAQASGSEKVTAEALFEDARKLVADKKYAEACPKFAASERLDTSAATLLNLASCWEKVGRLATAWATYKEAASAANAAGRKEYVAAAERHADALAPTLARLTVNVAAPVEGIQVRRDGVNMDQAEWGASIPIDTGTHQLEATAPGHKPWTSSVDVAQDGAGVTATVPPLEAGPPDTTAVAPPKAGAAANPPADAAGSQPAPLLPASQGSTGSSQRIAGWILSGVGVAGLAASAGFALVAKNKFDNSVSNDCEAQNHNLCTDAGRALRSDARSAGDIATVAFALGGAAIVGGVALVLTAPSGKKTQETGRGPTLILMPTCGGAALKGAW